MRRRSSDLQALRGSVLISTPTTLILSWINNLKIERAESVNKNKSAAGTNPHTTDQYISIYQLNALLQVLHLI
jgi:hypothetical protein